MSPPAEMRKTRGAMLFQELQKENGMSSEAAPAASRPEKQERPENPEQ